MTGLNPLMIHKKASQPGSSFTFVQKGLAACCNRRQHIFDPAVQSAYCAMPTNFRGSQPNHKPSPQRRSSGRNKSWRRRSPVEATRGVGRRTRDNTYLGSISELFSSDGDHLGDGEGEVDGAADGPGEVEKVSLPLNDVTTWFNARLCSVRGRAQRPRR